MTIAPFAFGVFARVNSPKARPAWKACGQSLPALLACVLLRAGIDHIQYISRHLMDRWRRLSVEPGFRGTRQPSRRAGARSATGRGEGWTPYAIRRCSASSAHFGRRGG